MKIRHLLSAALLLLATTTLQAQSYGTLIGARGGLTIPSITPGGKKTPLSEGYSSRMAWGAGLSAEFRYTKTFSLQIGLEYSSQGGLKDGSQAIPAAEMFADPNFAPAIQGLTTALAGAAAGIQQFSAEGAGQINAFSTALTSGTGMPAYLYADFKSEAKFNYLMLPVQAKWGWNFKRGASPWRVYFGAGVFASYLISAERVSSGSGVVFADKLQETTLLNGINALQTAMVTNPIAQVAMTQMWLRPEMQQLQAGLSGAQDFKGTQDIYDDLKKFNFGFVGNVGFQYSFGEARRNNLFIEGGGNFGLVKIQKEDVNGQNRIGAGTVMVGYSRAIGRKM